MRYERMPYRRLTQGACTASVVLLLASAGAWAQKAPSADRGPNFDRRTTMTFAPRATDALERAAAIRDRLGNSVQSTFDDQSGVTRTLTRPTGPLTGRANGNPEQIGRGFLQANADLLGLEPADLATSELCDSVYSRISGTTHLYFCQRIRGLQVYNGQLQVNVAADGSILSVNNAFVSGINKVPQPVTTIDAAQAVLAAANQLGLGLSTAPQALSNASGPEKRTTLAGGEFSTDPIEARLMWLPVGSDVRLVWSFYLWLPGGNQAWDITVDAGSGFTSLSDEARVWTRLSWTSHAQYKVYPQPNESPNHLSPLPPGDGRVTVVDPADPTASPLGWHDTGSTSFTILRGNNVHAYEDQDANNQPPSSQPSCGASLDCTFPINLSSGPTTYTSAAITNLFYWNNIIHDIHYQYGFDEAAGNFQVNNFGRGGAGNDDVRAEGQDGSGTNNANFGTPPDGSRPRMQMYLWNQTSPGRDGDLDSGIMVHEYGHGVSNRLVGGPNNVSCLGNNQQPGEGLSDWWSLVFTAQVGDQGTDSRGLGAYVLGQPNNGPGIRTQPYSTDQAINNHTYESIRGMAIPHGVGEVWAEAAWEVYWALVDQYGFDPDLYNATGGAGNQRAMLYVDEGLKNTACSPTFTDVRDGIIAAATQLNGGADVCLIWSAFANFGLGVDAISGGSNSTNPTNGFNVPVACQGNTAPTVSITAPADGSTAFAGNAIAFSGTANDAQEGDLTSGLVWTSNLDGQIGTGGSFSAVLSVGTHTITASVADNEGLIGSDSITVSVVQVGGLFSVSFDAGTDGFAYLDDAFRNTSQPFYEDGTFQPTGGFTGGGLSVVVGGIDDNDINNMSGGWQRPFQLSSPQAVTLSLRYNLTQTGNYESNEFSQALVSVDGNLLGVGGNDFLAQIAGDGNGGPEVTTGWVQVSFDLGVLSAGVHDVTIGEFNVLKTLADESTEVRIDDVSVTATAQGNTPPTVAISAPADGATFQEGATVSFSGTATDVEDGNLTASLAWTSSLDGAIGSGGSFSTVLSVGTHTITASVTDSGGLSGSDAITVAVNPAPGGGCLHDVDFESGAGGWTNGTSTCSTGDFVVGVPDATTWQLGSGNPGNALFTQPNFGGIGTDDVDGGTCEALSPVINASGEAAVSVSLDYFHGQRDAGDDPSDGFVIDVLNNGSVVDTLVSIGDVTNNPAWTSVSTVVNNPGNIQLRVRATDGSSTGDIVEAGIDNVQVCPATPQTCTVDDDLESGVAGWFNDAASTCSTGTYIAGNPTLQTTGGLTTQVGGAHSGVTAIFTATNSSLGVDDVDGGNCVLGSPIFPVSQASTLSVAYYHGQRDAGDDNGDFFRLEYSLDGGATFNTMASNGDATSNAAWSTATAPIPAGSNVTLRMQCSDGPATGDIVECGLDDVAICSN